MNTLKGWITTTVLMATLMVSTASANGGIIIGGNRNQPTQPPCTETQKTDDKSSIGIIIGGGISIIIGGLTGIIIGGNAIEPVNCGIIIGGQ